jgi:monoamine oxidase
VSVLIAGAGLAGLTAARDLSSKGADVAVIDARPRIGGRVLTRRAPFQHRQHAEAGGDLIDEDQQEICTLIGELGLRRVPVLPGGFTAIRQVGAGRRIAGRSSWDELERRLAPEIRAFCLSERRWDSAVARGLGRESVSGWLDRTRAPKALRTMAKGLRGFFLADPDDLSLLALVDQFAEDGAPGGGKIFRLQGGNDRIAASLAEPLGRRVRLNTILRAVARSPAGVIASVETAAGLEQVSADFLVCTLPATTLSDVTFEPGLPEPQRDAIQRLKYGHATKTALQFKPANWRTRGTPRAFGTSLPIGAVWDGNEEQRGSSGILTLLAGGRASAATQSLLASGGPARLVEQIDWLDLEKTELLAWDSLTWENERWSRGGYAFFDHAYNPAAREWLARPCGRIVFAGEHTSLKWQGYMNGAVETGLRASAEIDALMTD